MTQVLGVVKWNQVVQRGYRKGIGCRVWDERVVGKTLHDTAQPDDIWAPDVERMGEDAFGGFTTRVVDVIVRGRVANGADGTAANALAGFGQRLDGLVDAIERGVEHQARVMRRVSEFEEGSGDGQAIATNATMPAVRLRSLHVNHDLHRRVSPRILS
nr:hypothetical protein [Luteibacter rhizovicinus]